MRQFLTLVLLLLTSSSFCQPLHRYMATGSHNNALSSLLSPQSSGADAAMRTTAPTLQRVIAQSTRDSATSTLSDSADLKYTGANYSHYDYNMMLYPYNYSYST